jgi:hypothetical protein
MLFRWDGSQVVLENSMNFRSFKVVVPGSGKDAEKVQRAFAAIGRFETEQVFWVFEAALRGWPTCIAQPDWQSGLDAMIAKAAPHGWVDAATGAIRAHVEFEEQS